MEVAKIIFREDLYPRIEKSPVTVQKYADDLDVLPPIEVNQHGELIDGWHRWTAHKKAGALEIKAVITETTSDVNFLELAIERNAAHGLQLSQEDKRNMARHIYHITPEKERDAKKKHLALILSVSERTVRDWLSRIDKDSREARNKRIFDLWMACYTQEEIGEKENLSHQAVDLILQEMADLPKLAKKRSTREGKSDFFRYFPGMAEILKPLKTSYSIYFSALYPAVYHSIKNNVKIYIDNAIKAVIWKAIIQEGGRYEGNRIYKGQHKRASGRRGQP
ncbi:MAG: ParB/RepB/Spo0J family partition protein [Candidatus Omnitrophota bacterium]|nr:ParB/RepB/Spo0J family partition protein [Candidatus Omnitrophota bacterium]